MTGEARAAAAGYHRLVLPTPFAVGDVNGWLVEDDPLTLVDCGINWATSLHALEAAMAAHGRRIEDLGRLVITHQHVDHCGLAAIVAERSGAEVCALDHLAPVLEDFRGHAAADDDFTAAIMRRHGLPDDLVTTLRATSRVLSAFGSSVTVDRPLCDGGELPFASRTWTVHHRPGHSPTDTVFGDAAAGLLVAGDHVLGHISSNPVLSRPVGGASGDPDGPRPRTLLRYRASLAETRATPGVDLVLTGHGDVVEDLGTLLDGREAGTERRAAKVLGLLREHGPQTGHGLARRMWGRTALEQPLLTLSEAVGHLDLLAERGEVAEDAAGDVSTWAATG